MAGSTARPRRLLGVLVVVLAGALAGPAVGVAAPPPNDSPHAAAAVEPYTAANGTPQDLEAFADLAGATADAGVPRCLGPSSFARTAWYRIPPAETPQELTVEATGRTLDVVDLAAFVQPEGATGPVTREPNACAGVGSGGADAAEEPTSGVTLRVPARRAVLVQVGRHGPVRSVDDERVLLSLDTRPVVIPLVPAGDAADARTPAARARRATLLRLGGATITEEDPAQPPCPSLGTVWRRLVPGRSGYRVLSVTGSGVSTLAVFAGRRPTADNALDCINRTAYGPLQLRVPLRRHRPLWIRIGSDQPPSGAKAAIRLSDGAHETVVDGGPGGFDPTTGGPGGGLPVACASTKVERARIAGPRFSGAVAAYNRRPTIPVRLAVRGGQVCDVQVDLVGRRGRVYATARAIRLKGRRVVRLRRVRGLVRGRYRLHVTAISQLGDRARVRTNVRGRLR